MSEILSKIRRFFAKEEIQDINIFLKNFDSSTATLEMKSEAFRVFAELAYLYGEALGWTNYIESTVNVRGRVKDEPLVFTMQRANGKTPHALRIEAEKDRDEWKAIAWEAVRDLQQLRDEPECGWSNDIDKHIQDCYDKENEE